MRYEWYIIIYNDIHDNIQVAHEIDGRYAY